MKKKNDWKFCKRFRILLKVQSLENLPKKLFTSIAEILLLFFIVKVSFEKENNYLAHKCQSWKGTMV
jgi:hypothetical protein